MNRKNNNTNKHVLDYFKREDERNKQKEEYKKKIEKNAIFESYRKAHMKDFEEQDKSKLLNESLKIREDISNKSVARVITKLVEQSLLLDLNEYNSLNENYSFFIEETILKFLENTKIDNNLVNENTIKILQFVESNLPSNEEIKQLNEGFYDELGEKSYDTVSDEINALSTNVMERVAEIVEDSRRETEDIDNNLNVIRTESTKFHNKKTDEKNVLEILTLNEAKEMLKEGKEYDHDLALANAITYITILETLDATGLVKIGKEGYNKIINISKKSSSLVLESTYDDEIKSKIKNKVEETKQEKQKTFLYENAAPTLDKPKYTFKEWKAMQESKQNASIYKKNGKNISEDEAKHIILSEGYTEVDIEKYGFDHLAKLTKLL